MSLVKFITETQVITRPLPESAINDALKLDNKELLLVSLLEKLCQTLDQDHHLFKKICQYLYKIGILEDHKLFTDRKKQVRQMYSDYLIQLIGQHQIENPMLPNTPVLSLAKDYKPEININKLVFNHSFYSMNFIELEKLGNGGFGEVYKVYNKLDTRKYAIKMVPFMNMNDPNNIRAFNEVRCLSELAHDNVARYYTTWLELSDKKRTFEIGNGSSSDSSDSQSDELNVPIYPVLYIQMELCMTTLREYLLQRNYSRDSPGNLGLDKNIIQGILRGMTYIHSHSILHRDLNPNNIFLDANLNPKIGDFGMAVKVQDTSSQVLQLSPNYGVDLYMPPEYREKGQYTNKSDVYSAGLIFFEIFSDFKTEMERYRVMTEFKMDSSKAHVPYLSVITQMTEHDPLKRPEFSEILT